MEGIQYVTNERGHRVAVMIDLQKYGEVWEDFHDVLISRLRAREPRESLATVKRRLCRQGKIHE